jgi:uncharacterized membrane protein YesL
MTDLPVSSGRDEESEKKTELGARSLKERLISETQEYDRIYTEARGIVGSILVVVGIILAAGTTFLINTASELSILYLTGVSLLIASIIFVFLILNHKRLIMGINPKYVKYQFNDPKITYDKMLRIGIIELQERIEVEAASNQLNRKYLKFAWLCLIAGLIMVMLFVVVSILVQSEIRQIKNVTSSIDKEVGIVSGQILDFLS